MPRRNSSGRETPRPKTGPRGFDSSIYPHFDREQRYQELVQYIKNEHGLWRYAPTPSWIKKEARRLVALEGAPRYSVPPSGKKTHTSARSRKAHRASAGSGGKPKKSTSKRSGSPPNKKPTKGRRHH